MRKTINRTWEVEIQKYFLKLARWSNHWNRICLYLCRGWFKFRCGKTINTVAVWILAVYNKHCQKNFIFNYETNFSFYILISPLTQKDSWLLCRDLWVDIRTCEFLVELHVNHYTSSQPEPCLELSASEKKIIKNSK